MYVDDEQGDDTGTTTDTGGDDELTVEVDGETYEVEENYDFDQDGQNDTAVVETEDGGYVAYADTDGDGTADVAVEFDEDGNIVAGAEYNESTGEWTEEDVDSLPTPSGDGADEGSGGSSGDDRDDRDDRSDRDSDTGSDTGSDSNDRERESDSGSEDTNTGDTSSDDDSGSDRGSDESITVETQSGEFEAGEAEYDMDGDGTNDTAIVTDADGTTYAFTDEDGDGTADTAVVIEADGDVTVAENTGGDDWEVTEEGHIDSDGTYESETTSSTSGSDSAWAESR